MEEHSELYWLECVNIFGWRSEGELFHSLDMFIHITDVLFDGVCFSVTQGACCIKEALH